MQLDHATSLEIAIAVFKNEPLTGYGPENFNYAYSQLRADRQNNSEFWSLRYFKGGSFMLDYFINNGLLGILSYLALLAAAVFAIFRTSQAFNPDTPDRAGAVLASTLLTALIVAQFVYSANMVLLWLFWLGLALMG
jgi:O-antigen ligase